MQRLLLSILRFCLSAWVGIAIFFVVHVIELPKSDLFKTQTKFEHPKVLFPLYYAFEFALLIPALVCACAGLGNSNIGRGRRIAILQLLIVATALAAWDFGLIYQKLIEMMASSAPLPAEFHSLHRMSRWLNEAMLTACTAAIVLALLPEESRSGRHNVDGSQTGRQGETARTGLLGDDKESSLLTPAGCLRQVKEICSLLSLLTPSDQRLW